MCLLIWSIIISFNTMISLKFIPRLVSLYLDKYNKDHVIKSKLLCLKKEQSEISMVKEFAKHAKLQRTINKLNEQLKNNIRETATKNLKIKFICKVSLYIFTTLLNLVFLFYNYHQTVINQLPFNCFSPLTWLVSWPSSPVDTMSFIFWYSITNCVAKVTINNIV